MTGLRVVPFLILAASPLSNCTQKKAPAPVLADPANVIRCNIEDGRMVGAQFEIGKITMENGSPDPVRIAAEGVVSLDVLHATKLDDASPLRVCGGTGSLTKANYESNPVVRGKTLVTMSGACTPPPTGKLLRVRASFLQTGKTAPVSCTFLAEVPAALGGTGVAGVAQEARLDWDKFIASAPAQAKPITDYASSLSAAVASVGSPLADRSETKCPATVTGTTPLMGYRALRDIGTFGTSKGKPEGPDVDEPRGDGRGIDDPMFDSLRLAVTTSPTKYVDAQRKVGEISKWLSATPPSRYVAVVSTRRYTMPAIVQSGTKAKNGTYSEGAWFGSIAVVDRETGKVQCGAPMSATSRETTTDPAGTFIDGIRAMTWKTLSRIAPGLRGR
jgi:hypothetical protein